MKLITILFCIALSATTAFSSNLIGRYSQSITRTYPSSANDSAEDIQKKFILSLELREDKGVRYRVQQEKNTLDYFDHKGAWAIHENRIYFLLKSSAWKYVCSAEFKNTNNSLELSNFSGWPMLLFKPSLQLAKDDSVIFPYDLKTSTATEAKKKLDTIIQNIPNVKYSGSETLESFKRQFYHAIETEDASILQALTYIRKKSPFKSPQLHYYLKYVSDFLRDGEYNIEEVEGEQLTEKLISMKNQNIGFPDDVEPKGYFMMMKRTKNRNGGTGLYYGIINGRWALIGNPTNIPQKD